MINPPLVEDGHIARNDLPCWGAEWDGELFRSLVVADY